MGPRSCTGHGEGAISSAGPVLEDEELMFQERIPITVRNHRGTLCAVAVFVNVRGDRRDTGYAKIEWRNRLANLLVEWK